MFASSFVNSSNFWFNYIAGIGFAAATVWAVVTFVHKRFIKQITGLVAKEIDNDFTQKIADEVSEIYHETRHNGGSSMKDALKRLEENTAEGFQKIEKQQETLERYIQKLDKALERHFGYHEGLED